MVEQKALVKGEGSTITDPNVQPRPEETDWVEERDRNILSTFYYCETCNMIIELGDVDVARHKTELSHHKMRRVSILRCNVCGNIVTDCYAEYSPERNQFWCRNCIIDLGHEAFRTAPISQHQPGRGLEESDL